MSRSVLRYGLLAGVAISAIIIGPFFLFGPQPKWMEIGEIVGYTGMVLSMSAVFFAIRHERAQRGALTFNQAFLTGLGVTLVAALLFGFATWILYASAGDALPLALIDFYTAQIHNSGADAATIAAKLAELEGMRSFFFNRPLQAALMFATVFLIGAALSLIAAWIYRRPAADQPGRMATTTA